MGSPNDSRGSVSPLNFKFFGSTHINKSKVAIGIHHQIFWFKVSIDNAIGMHVFHHEEDLPHEKASMLDCKGDDFGDDIEKVFSLNQFHDEVDEVAVFKEFVEVDDEGMSGGGP